MKCTLEIRDEVNVRFRDVDPSTRRKMSDALKFFNKAAYHQPAYKLGRWDGYIRFFDVGGRTYMHLIDRVLPILIENGYEIDIDDKRKPFNCEINLVDENSYNYVTWPSGHPAEGEPIVLRDYQVDIINSFLQNLQSLQIAATGAGKTLVTAALSDRVEKMTGGRTIVIVPNKDLVTQTEDDYNLLGLDVGVLFGDRKEYNNQHLICTWQSISSLVKDAKDGKRTEEYGCFFDNISCVMVDEVHKAKANVLKDLLSNQFAHVPIRWGLTGTIPEDELESISCICALGPVVKELRSKELQDKGVLSKLDIDILQLQDGIMGFSNYQQELKWLTTDPTRLKYISEIIEAYAKGGNTLVLVDRIETGKILQQYNPDWVFVRGATKSTERKQEYKDINEASNKVVIATFGVAAVGINIPRIFNLIMLEAGKSYVRVIQSIGRGIRKAKDKDYVQIVDITSSHRYSKSHLAKRKKFYKDQHFPYNISKVKYK